jgi:hypothetical protein
MLAALLLAPASSFGAAWVNFSTVTGDPGGGRTVAQPKLAADAAGNQVAVWIEQPSPFKVVAAFRPAGGAWGPAQVLDSLATTAPGTDLAVDGSGNFIVLYNEIAGGVSKVFARYLPAGQSAFGAPEQVGGNNAAAITAPAVAFDGSGRAYAAYGITGTATYAGYRPAGAGSTWTLLNTNLPTNSTIPDIAVTSAGEATIVDVGGAAVRYWRLLAGGTQWTQLTATAPNPSTTVPPIVVVDGGGQTTTLYLVAITNTQVATQTCPSGTGACAARQILNGTTTNAATPALAVDSSGNALASYSDCPVAGPCANAIRVSRRVGSAGTFGTPVQIGTGITPAMTFDSTGASMALFRDAGARVNFALAAAGSSLAPPATAITDPAQSWAEPRLAADGNGNVFGAWSGAGVQSAVYDTQPPATPTLTPAVASSVAGTAVSFTAAATDTWSGVAYDWDFGDGTTATGSPASHRFSSAGTYSVRVWATDAAGNQSSRTQAFDVTARRSALARPIAGKTVNLEPVSGVVTVKVPGSKRFVPLVTPTQVQNGSIIDARKGRVRITIDDGRGGLDTAEFYEGIFKVTQPKVKAGHTWFANLYLVGGSFKGCPRAPRNPRVALFSGKNGNSQSRSVRHLWGSGDGAFRTVGRFSSATIRGTTWLTDDRCNGTLTRVTAGKVGVRDFVLKKTIVVKAPESYLAKPKKK